MKQNDLVNESSDFAADQMCTMYVVLYMSTDEGKSNKRALYSQEIHEEINKEIFKAIKYNYTKRQCPSLQIELYIDRTKTQRSAFIVIRKRKVLWHVLYCHK